MLIQKSTKELYSIFRFKMQKAADVRSASAVLQWDQETYMPAKGAAKRGQQIATLSALAHDLFAEDELGDILNELNVRNELPENEKRNVELTLEDYTKNKKYSSAFVHRLSEQINKSFHAWIEARKQSSFSLFEKELDLLIQLKKEEAEILGYQHHPYNALVNEYEKGYTVDLLDKMFGLLLPLLEELFDKIQASSQVDDSFLKQHFPKQEQWDWGNYLINQLGFDLKAGRQDISEHPFSTSFANTDVRITTRINENDFTSMTWGCIHEVGHALYEQGLPEEHYGMPLSEACSFSIHESQSRLWENNVGRSLSFWNHFYPALQKGFITQFKNVTLNQFYKGINKAQASLIRTEADELTYHFHVMIRYELEKKLIEGSIRTPEIPSFWNEHYEKYLGLKVPDDKRGCLQDVHWSHGSFGYFPTYSLGSLYAAQFFHFANEQIMNLDEQIAAGNTTGLLNWLRLQVHQYGRKYTSEELCKKITGKSLDIAFFVNHLLQKYRVIYTL